MKTNHESERLLRLLGGTMLALVASDAADLSGRQSAVLLECFLNGNPQTVRGLAATLRVSKPAVSRALDRLSELGLARRLPDPADGRSVLVQVTARGRDYLGFVRSVMSEAEGASARSAAPDLIAA